MTREELQGIKDRWDKTKGSSDFCRAWFADIAIGPFIDVVERLMGDREALLEACIAARAHLLADTKAGERAVDLIRSAIAKATQQ